MAELPRGTVTFLFTDIEGSTQLLKQLGEVYATARGDHHRLLRAAFVRHDGEEIDTQGDAFFVAFRRAKDAVVAAADSQRALTTHAWPQGAQLRVRMGIHTGEPSVSDEGYLGLAVHRGARICSAGHGGQVLLSQATVALLEDQELPGLELRDLGVHELKDIDRPERIYQLVIAGLPDEFPSLKAPQSQATGATPFEGREGELAEAAQAAVAARPWYRTRSAALTLAIVVLAALVAALLVVLRETTALSRIETDSAGLIDADSNELRKQVAVGSTPGAIAAGGGAVFVAVGDGTISRIDPDAGLVTQTIPLDGMPSGIAFGEGALWVVSSDERSVRRIALTGTRPGEPIEVGNGPSAVAVGLGAVWVANRLDDTVTRVPTGRGAKRVFKAGLTPSGVAVGEGAVWITNEAAGTVSRLDPSSGALQSINVGNSPGAIAAGHGSVWVANSLDNTVARIDPLTNTVKTVIPVGVGPSAIATGAGDVWVANRYSGTVSRIDASSNRIADTIEVGESPGGIAFTERGAWVSARAPLTNHRGGVLRVFADLFDEVDPAAAYTPYSWAVATITNDGLLTFKRVAGAEGTQVVPDLAVSVPRPSSSGKTYTFRIRSGIRYSTGQPVRASDFRRGLERFFEVQRGPPYYRSLVGASECVRRPRPCDLGRGVVANDAAGTVTFNLRAPDPEFLFQLAVPFAAAVPEGVPSRVARTGSLVPATGPYRVAEFVRGRRVELVRNPRFREWSRAAQPDGFPDRIVVDLAGTPGNAVTRIQRGALDVMSGLLPGDRLDELTTRFAEQLHVNARAQTFYLFLNTRVPPFDDVDVRRALNFAVDRDELIRRFLGALQLQQSCQILPPNLPGYRPYCPYTQAPTRSGTWTSADVPRAQQLVRRSGTRGASVIVWAFRDPTAGSDVELARYVASVLQSLGYRTSLKIVDGVERYLVQVNDSRNRAQIGSYGWLTDYPAASSFISSLLTCDAFRPGTSGQSNVSEFCNRRIDARVRRALELQTSDQPAASALWAQIDRELTDQAPFVTIANAKTLGFVSKRVGNYQYNPQWGVLLSQVWVR